MKSLQEIIRMNYEAEERELKNSTHLKSTIPIDQIGDEIGSRDLIIHDPKAFQAILLDVKLFGHAQTYLLENKLVFQYIGTSGALLVPNAVAADLKERFGGKSVKIYNRTCDIRWP